MSFLRTTTSEFLKLVIEKSWLIVLGLIVIIQPGLAYIEAGQLLSTGLNATTESDSNLIESIPPIDYFGFDIAVFGLMAMVVFGGIAGAVEYRHHNLRTSVLCNNSRFELFTAKMLSIVSTTIVISFISIYLTVVASHSRLGELGLNPIQLSGIAWEYIGYTIINWTLITLLAFFLGMYFKNAIVPLVFLVPQIYNLGDFLVQKWSWTEFLPIAGGKMMVASPTSFLSHDPLKGGMILLAWAGVALLLGMYSFRKLDVGGEY